SAVDSCSDIRINEFQSVTPVGRRRLIRKTEVEQRPVEPVTGPVAGKDPSSPVSAMRRGSEANNQQPRIRRSEAGNRPSPIVPIPESSDLCPRNLFAVFDQAGASPAVDNLLLGRQLCHSGGLS